MAHIPFLRERSVVQAAVEKTMFEAGDGKSQMAPAQRVGDFIKGNISSDLPESSYVQRSGVESRNVG